MGETSKTNEIRGEAFLNTYCSGRVIDIGCGDELVVANAEGFDLAQGDANFIDELRDADSYDCVHSAHCLEHMMDPKDAMARWWKLVKPGGHMIIVVPDEDLYEQGEWPSRFNEDHKATFRLDKPDTWSPVSYDLRELAEGLPGGQLISAEVHDHHYNRGMLRKETEGLWSVVMRHQLIALFHHLNAKQILTTPLVIELNRFFFELGVTVDQTIGPALAQIQVVVQKHADT